MQHALTVRNDLGDLPRVSAWAGELLGAPGYGERDRFRVDLVLEEAVTNIINSAYPEGGSHEISLVAQSTPERLSIDVIDGGRPFNPLDAPPKAQPARLEDAEPGGFGLVLIRKYCDGLRYERTAGRNRLTLVFDMVPKAETPG